MCCALELILAQDLTLHSKSELVVTPASIVSKRGVRIEGLEAADLVLYDNNVPRQIHVDDVPVPISLALVVQTTATTQPILDKLRKEASLLEPILTGDRGEVAIVTFAADPQVVDDFTSDFTAIARRLRNLDAEGGGASAIDAVRAAVDLLARRPPERRRVILLIGEKHDRSSKLKIPEVIAAALKANVTIYAVSFSPMLTPFTTKAPHNCDPEKKCRNCDRTCGMCARQCYRDDGKAHAPPPRYEEMQVGLLAVLVKSVSEAVRLADTDLAAAFAQACGGTAAAFLTKDGLEKTLNRIGEDLHNQYMISFQPDANAPPGFHEIRVEVKDRPDLTVRTRAGYWKN
jgi:VWFA-related protein